MFCKLYFQICPTLQAILSLSSFHPIIRISGRQEEEERSPFIPDFMFSIVVISVSGFTFSSGKIKSIKRFPFLWLTRRLLHFPNNCRIALLLALESSAWMSCETTFDRRSIKCLHHQMIRGMVKRERGCLSPRIQ